MATCGAEWTPESERKATLRDVVQRLEHVFYPPEDILSEHHCGIYNSWARVGES